MQLMLTSLATQPMQLKLLLVIKQQVSNTQTSLTAAPIKAK